jgi:hypothetical protein
MHGETVDIKKVLVFPPNESYNSLVNLDSLKGRWNYLSGDPPLS